MRLTHYLFSIALVAISFPCQAEDVLPVEVKHGLIPQWVTDWKQGRKAFQDRDYEKSKQLYQKAIEGVNQVNPQSKVLISIFNHLGETFHAMGDKEKEINALKWSLFYARIINFETIDVQEKLCSLGEQVYVDQAGGDECFHDASSLLGDVYIRHDNEEEENLLSTDEDDNTILECIGKKRVLIAKQRPTSKIHDWDECACDNDCDFVGETMDEQIQSGPDSEDQDINEKKL